jgi:O-antigen/teichoic acid export membrane protein
MHSPIPTVDTSSANISASSARGSVWAVSAEAVDFVLRIAAIAILARLLIPEHFGLISMVTAITAVAERFKDAGLSIATVQFKDITHDQISVLFWVNIVVGVLLAAVVVGLSFPIVAFYQDDRLLEITWAIALSFLFGGATVQHHALLRRTMQFRPIALIQLGASVGSIVIAVLVAVLGGE